MFSITPKQTAEDATEEEEEEERVIMVSAVQTGAAKLEVRASSAAERI